MGYVIVFTLYINRALLRRSCRFYYTSLLAPSINADGKHYSWFKNLLVLLSFISLISCRESQEHAENIVVGISPDYPPFEYKRQNQIVGFDVDLANIIAKELNKSLEIKDIAFADLIPALKDGKIDMVISCMAPTSERAKSVDFSKVYYNISGISLLFNANKRPIYSSSNLDSLIIGIQSGTAIEALIKENAKNLNFELFPLEDSNMLIERLKNGEIDAIATETLQAQSIKWNNPEFGYIEISRLPVMQPLNAPLGIAVAFRKGSNLCSHVDTVIDKLINSGKIKELDSKWLHKSTEPKN